MTPPALPGSRKRILPAFILCFAIGFLGAHRLYVGRYVSGVVQLVASLASYWWLKRASEGLLELKTPEQILDWLGSHSLPMAPLVLFIAVGGWVAIDSVVILARKFKDGRGEKITEWT